MKPKSHTIDITDDGNIALTFTVEGSSGKFAYAFVLTPEQAETLANDLYSAVEA